VIDLTAPYRLYNRETTMTRRFIPTAIAASLTTLAAQAQSNSSTDSLLAILRASMEAKKGVTIHVHGAAVAMLVSNINDHFVEGRSQQSSRIVVRLASIDAFAMA